MQHRQFANLLVEIFHLPRIHVFNTFLTDKRLGHRPDRRRIHLVGYSLTFKQGLDPVLADFNILKDKLINRRITLTVKALGYSDGLLGRPYPSLLHGEGSIPLGLSPYLIGINNLTG